MPEKLSVEQAIAFLATYHDREVTDVELLHGGYWSSAFGYRVDGRDLVVRFGAMRDGYEADRAAAAFERPGLPVPDVLAIGEAFGGFFAISTRSYGRFLEDLTVADATNAGPALDALLAALRSVPPELDHVTHAPWHQWLRDGLADDVADRTVQRWRATLARDHDLNELFEASAARVNELLAVCPDRRDLLHGDLLHQNVLLSDDASRVTAVFSWKCSTRGDFLFDVAWCTFWSHWHPGIKALDVWSRTLSARDLTADDLIDAPLRHHCYELQIGASHLGWYVWTEDADNLARAAAHVRTILDRGPLASPPGVL